MLWRLIVARVAPAFPNERFSHTRSIPRLGVSQPVRPTDGLAGRVRRVERTLTHTSQLSTAPPPQPRAPTRLAVRIRRTAISRTDGWFARRARTSGGEREAEQREASVWANGERPTRVNRESRIAARRSRPRGAVNRGSCGRKVTASFFQPHSIRATRAILDRTATAPSEQSSDEPCFAHIRSLSKTPKDSRCSSFEPFVRFAHEDLARRVARQTR